jgi:hypothetical protein
VETIGGGGTAKLMLGDRKIEIWHVQGSYSERMELLETLPDGFLGLRHMVGWEDLGMSDIIGVERSVRMATAALWEWYWERRVSEENDVQLREDGYIL